MRYAIIPKTVTAEVAMAKCKSVGAVNVQLKRVVKQVFCEMSEAQANTLSRDPTIRVKSVGKVRADQLVYVPLDEVGVLQLPKLSLYDVFNPLREMYIPGLDGIGLTVAVLDSGVRETHESLEGRVVYSEDFSGSGNTEDEFGHGTGVAFIIAGKYGAHSGVAPGAKLMNMRVLDESGVGTEEAVVDGIEATLEKAEEAMEAGLHLTDDDYPNTIHLSLGVEDDGDWDNVMRAACRTAVEEYGLEVIVAAGNTGPNPSTVLCPACEPRVIAVGGILNSEFTVWGYSGRGPTEEGYVKPDLVAWAENIEVASHKSDSGYMVKSGTSFSAPILTGVDGLLWDLSRRVYGQEMRVRYSDWLQYAYAYCIKPEGAPLEKDNTYGYGLPAVSTMISRLTRPVAPTPVSAMEMMIPAMMIMMMIPLMRIG